MQTAVIFAQEREGKEARKRSLGDRESRYLGRLVSNQKNQVLNGLCALLATPGTLLFGGAYAQRACHILLFSDWFETREVKVAGGPFPNPYIQIVIFHLRQYPRLV